jgi:predicted kinase
VGKTAVSRRVAERLGATYLRIDTIEAAIVTTFLPFGDHPVGYVVAQRVAADQLRSGRAVVADAVNGVAQARDGWLGVAAECAVPVRLIEVVCSDAVEHRRRVESRRAEMPGHDVPTWAAVQQRRFDPLPDGALRVDNLGDVEQQVAAVLTWLGETASR